MVSLAAAAAVAVPVKLVMCLGFGIDAYHGVCHAQVLETIAALARTGAYYGAFSVLRKMAEGQAFLDAVAFAQDLTPRRPSIVNGSIAAAVAGEFGDVQFTQRTEKSELFINPLMSLYFAFDLMAIAQRSLYLPLLEGSETLFEVAALIEAFRKGVSVRPARSIPH
jgi:hypothetical protein